MEGEYGMTREEEIKKEAYRVSYNGDEFHSFIQGAKWADKTMIVKLNEEVLKLKGVSCVRDERPIGGFGLKTCTKTKRYSK